MDHPGALPTLPLAVCHHPRHVLSVLQFALGQLWPHATLCTAVLITVIHTEAEAGLKKGGQIRPLGDFLQNTRELLQTLGLVSLALHVHTCALHCSAQLQ